MIYLIHKELRERSSILAVGAILGVIPLLCSLILPLTGNWLLKNIHIPIVFFDLIILVIIFPIVIAESQVAGEIEKKTLSFLLSLPETRLSLWLSKLLSCIIAESALILLFLLVNSPILFKTFHMLSFLTMFQAVLFILFIGMYYLTIAFFCSTITTKSMTASAGSLLLLILLLFSQSVFCRSFQWEITLKQNVLVMAVQMIIMLAVSLHIFVKAEFFNLKKRLGVILRASLAGLAVCAASMVIIFLASPYLFPPKALGFESLATEPEGERLLASVETEGAFSSLMWILNPAKRETVKFREANIFAPIFIGKNRLQYDTINPVNIFLKGKVVLEHWMLDLSTGKKKLLYSSETDIKSMGSFFAKSITRDAKGLRLILILPKKEKKTVRLDITIVSEDGHVVGDFRLPQKMSQLTVPYDESESGKEGRNRLELLYLKKDGKEALYAIFPYRSEERGETLSISEIDLKLHKMKSPIEIPLGDRERYSDFVISPDAKALAAVRNKPSFQLISRNLDEPGSSWKVLIEEKGAIRNLQWLSDGQIACLVKDGEKGDRILLVDSSTGKARTIQESTLIQRFEPTLKKDGLVFIGMTRGSRALAIYMKSLDEGAEPVKVSGKELPKDSKWNFLWKNENELIYYIYPWEVYSVTFDEKGAHEVKLFPYEEAK